MAKIALKYLLKTHILQEKRIVTLAYIVKTNST